jgi:glycosyltransferase involved in cell wall biosynthesis
MFVVAYLYNNNGMASWCWEAAHALHEMHQPVLLVCSNEVELPGTPVVEVLRFNPQTGGYRRKDLLSRIAGELERLSGESSGFVYLLHQHLQELGIEPSAYFLNQSNLQDPRVDVPQYITAWAYPTSLKGYLSKVGKLTGWKISKPIGILRKFFELVGWWKKDWRAYRNATSVLAVSQRLSTELVSQGIRGHIVHPGTSISAYELRESANNVCQVLIAAEDLEEPRKRVRWMINALKSSTHINFSLTLVGHASNAFKKWVCDDFPAKFTGHLPRNQLQNLMAEHDVFLFGSCHDDWGYVLVEAMSQGLVIVAPKISPFDEIVEDTGILYSLASEKEFAGKVLELCNSNLFSQRKSAWERANRLFSRHAFGQSLLDVYEETTKKL